MQSVLLGGMFLTNCSFFSYPGKNSSEEFIDKLMEEADLKKDGRIR